jgi:hypothetical protein
VIQRLYYRRVQSPGPTVPDRVDKGRVVVVDVLHERCAGLDIGKADLKAVCGFPVRGGPASGDQDVFDHDERAAGTGDWLLGRGVTVVALEATGVYWKPVYYLLEAVPHVQVLNAAHMHNVPGRKTDVTDSAWIARLVEHGLVRHSFVPPPLIRRLRDLTRYRSSLVAERTREKQRVEKVLEDACIKLSGEPTTTASAITAASPQCQPEHRDYKIVCLLRQDIEASAGSVLVRQVGVPSNVEHGGVVSQSDSGVVEGGSDEAADDFLGCSAGEVFSFEEVA